MSLVPPTEPAFEPVPEPRRFAAACADFVRSLGHATQLVSLYGCEHLIAAAALRECWLTAEALLTSRGRDTLTFGLEGGRWLIDGLAVAEESSSQEALGKLVRRHGIRSLGLSPGVKMYELAAFCSLASTAPSGEEWDDAEEYLAVKGVRRLALNKETFVPARAVPAAPRAPSLDRPAAPPAGAPAPARRGFASLLRDLVEESVQDDEERSHLYEEALGLVKEALDRKVAEATARLKREKEGALRSRLRTEQVLAAVAEGKVVVDRDGRVLNMNPAAEEISGSRLSELAGKPLSGRSKNGELLVVLAEGLGEDDGGPAPPGVRVEAGEGVRSAIGRAIAVVQDRDGRVVGTCAALPDAVKFKELQKFEEDLLSRVTHELKAPLTSLCAALEIVTEKAGGRLDAEGGEFLDSCRRNTVRLQKTIDDILDFSRLRAGRMDVRPVPERVEPLLKETVESLSPWARKQGLKLDAAAPEGLPPVLADRQRLLQILNNLVSNAIKSTPPGGSVSLSVERGTDSSAGLAVFRVQDTGCGIPETDQKRIFQEFVRVAGQTRSCEGVGLGLAIVHELVKRHGGAVWVESRPGSGAAFFFTIPFAPGADAAPRRQLA